MEKLTTKELIKVLSVLGEDKTVLIEDHQGNYYDLFPQDIDESEQVVRIFVNMDPLL